MTLNEILELLNKSNSNSTYFDSQKNNVRTWEVYRHSASKEIEEICFPGFKRSDLSVQISEGQIYDKCHEIKVTARGRYNIDCCVYLSECDDSSQISAKFENGLLTLNIPKKKQNETRTINIDIQ